MRSSRHSPDDRELSPLQYLLAIRERARPRHSLQPLVVADLDQPKPHAIALEPLEVIDQAPVVIAAHIQRRPKLTALARAIEEMQVIADELRPQRVLAIGQAVLGHDKRLAELGRDSQIPLQPFGVNRPAVVAMLMA